MKKPLLILFASLLLLCLVQQACKKKPEPCFTMSFESVLTGDSVHFYNCSKHERAIAWEFGDGSSTDYSTENSAGHIYSQAGDYKVTLNERAKSYYNQKVYSTDKMIHVTKSVYGCMDPNSFNYDPLANRDDGTCTYLGSTTFYFSNSNYWFIDLNVDSKYLGKDSLCYPGALPDCESAVGCKKVTIGQGTHTYDAIFYDLTGNISKTKHGSFSVSPNTCSLFLLN